MDGRGGRLIRELIPKVLNGKVGLGRPGFVISSLRVRLAAMWRALLLAIAVGLFAASSAQADYWRNCGPPNRIATGEVRSHAVGCDRSRKVVNAFLRRAQSEGPNVFVDPFVCIGRISGGDMVVNCRDGVRKIHWRGFVG
jgi:hypothetical protein